MAELQVKQTAERCEPSQPAPQQTENPMCNGTFQMECCCPKLRTRTFALQLGPMTEAQLRTYIQNTVNAYESSGYMILGHSLVDIGAGWMLGLTVGWYA